MASADAPQLSPGRPQHRLRPVIISITIWDNMEHAAGLRTALGGVIQQLEGIGVRFEPAQVYELTAKA